MTNDIFEAWKKEKFILVPQELLDNNETLVVLTDYMYWVKHEEELQQWCKQYNINIEGMFAYNCTCCVNRFYIIQF